MARIPVRKLRGGLDFFPRPITPAPVPIKTIQEREQLRPMQHTPAHAQQTQTVGDFIVRRRLNEQFIRFATQLVMPRLELEIGRDALLELVEVAGRDE